MAYNGSGVYVRNYNWTNDANASINISSSRMDTEDNGFATGLSTAICKDGQTTITQNIPFNGKKITGLGAGTLATDAAQIGQVQAGQLNWAAAGGTADAITATYSPVNTSLTDGLLLFVRAGAANATTTPTFSPDGLTAHTITKNGGVALAAGDIHGAGHELALRYKLASTIWELLDPTAPAAVTDATISTTDVTTNNVTSTKHGFAPKSPADATKFMNGDTTPAYAQVKDSDLAVTDVTTNNASTSAHGFLKKLSNSATDYQDGTGAWSKPFTPSANKLVLGTLTLQWGLDSNSGNPRTISFGTAFSGTAYAVVATANTSSNFYVEGISSIGSSSFSVTQGTSNSPVYWFAVGPT